jgi:hypothetical protein
MTDEMILMMTSTGDQIDMVSEQVKGLVILSERMRNASAVSQDELARVRHSMLLVLQRVVESTVNNSADRGGH